MHDIDPDKAKPARAGKKGEGPREVEEARSARVTPRRPRKQSR